MTTLKILHVYKTSAPLTYGGVESVIANLTKTLNTNIIHSDIVCLGKENKHIKFFNTNIFVYKTTLNLSSCPFSLTLFFKYKKLIQNYDLIHYHYPWPFADVIHLLFARKKWSIVTYHSDIVKQKFLKILYKPIEVLFLKNVDKIIATSPNYCNISSNLKRFQKKTCVIPIGIETLKVTTADKKLTQELPKDYFVYVGVLRYYKGLDYLIMAIKETSFKLVIAGDGPQKTHLQKLSKAIAIDKQIIFLGKIDNDQKAQLIKNSIGFILPSHLKSEAFGVSLIEAASLSKPLISCKIGTGTEYININDQTGFCVEPGSPKALSEAITKLANKKLAIKFGTNAKKRFEKYFTVDIMAAKYLTIYQKICSQK